MRNRKVQREVRRTIGREKPISLVNDFGVKDPTAYEAIGNIVREEKRKRQKAINEAWRKVKKEQTEQPPKGMKQDPEEAVMLSGNNKEGAA